MNAPEIICEVVRAGGQLEIDHGDLIITALAPLPSSLVATVRQHKAELLVALSNPPGDDQLPDPVAEARRQRVLAMLAERPGVRYAVLTDSHADQEAVLLTLAIRDVGTCELAIPRAKYDGVLLLDLIEQHGGTVH